MKYLLIAYLLIIPNFYWWGKDTRYAQEMCYQMFSIILFFSSFFCVKKPIKLTKVSLFLGIFGLWTVVSYILTSGCTMGVNYLFNILCGCMVYFVTISCVKKEDTNLLFKTILVTFLIATGYSLVQALGYDIVGFHMRGQPTYRVPEPCALFALPAHYGIYGALAMMVFACFHPVLAVVFFGALFVSKASGVWVAASIGYIVLLWFRRKEVRFKFPFIWIRKKKRFFYIRNWVYVPVVYFMVLLMFTGAWFFVMKYDKPMGMFKTRPGAWKLIINDAMKHPVTGRGLDAFRLGGVKYIMHPDKQNTRRAIRQTNGMFLIEYDNDNVLDRLEQRTTKRYDTWDDPHNEYISLIYHFGLSGLVLLGFLLWAMKERLKKVVMTKELATLTCMVITLGLCSMTHFPMHVARIAHIAPVLLGLFMVWTE